VSRGHQPESKQLAPPRAYALLSGGKDSVMLAHQLHEADMLAGVISIDTGINIPEWKNFIHDLCAQQGWNLEMIRTPVAYEWLVRKWGFPGPGWHTRTMQWLKERAIDIFRQRHPGALLASGARQGESQRRLGRVKEWNVFGKMVVWNPLYLLTTAEIWAYVHEHKLPRSPCYPILGISGDCLCGAFAQPGERETLLESYPDVAARIIALEQEKGERWGAGKGHSRWSQSERLFCMECDPSGRPESGTR
jgi:3'-phosphoadenosine 5'-phosphosulfate sulfotransferase (PAPS reductase)/FAD synthetase